MNPERRDTGEKGKTIKREREERETLLFMYTGVGVYLHDHKRIPDLPVVGTANDVSGKVICDYFAA